MGMEYGLLGCAALANHPSLRAIFMVFVDVCLEKKEGGYLAEKQVFTVSLVEAIRVRVSGWSSWCMLVNR